MASQRYSVVPLLRSLPPGKNMFSVKRARAYLGYRIYHGPCAMDFNNNKQPSPKKAEKQRRCLRYEACFPHISSSQPEKVQQTQDGVSQKYDYKQYTPISKTKHHVLDFLCLPCLTRVFTFNGIGYNNSATLLTRSLKKRAVRKSKIQFQSQIQKAHQKPQITVNVFTYQAVPGAYKLLYTVSTYSYLLAVFRVKPQ